MRVLILLLLLSFPLIAHPAFADDVSQFVDDSELEDLFALDSIKTVEVYDPIEGVNRKIFAFNSVIDRKFFSPVARFYHEQNVSWLENVILNFFDNLGDPAISVALLLSGDFESAVRVFLRFCINSTLGLFGLLDVAGQFSLERVNKSIEEVLASSGMVAGPYIVLPFFGPATFRSMFATVIEQLLNPLQHIIDECAIIFAVHLMRGVIERARYANLSLEDEEDIDSYIKFRSVYYQSMGFIIGD